MFEYFDLMNCQTIIIVYRFKLTEEYDRFYRIESYSPVNLKRARNRAIL